ncbi:putative ABC-type amino acid transport/signal transduction systems, periplasmic component [Vibrio nigripulchritudo MADA3029]|uniref:substrate-binding periplasmic protein n=1 Tax=Vibrio nigripulchritudo TaxID=28173 RepID=UPI0003B1D205|nr:transporter substrate-binding domain-containing protein [Vibrio nigripulchritudo]CCN36409.1 putative ABC-type amino acid transport/signal transduction systems, periplasmic component [Vibrio nigripulchritudo AM115]CCN40700.1 putative ABC-type amino acid transport/signal transduction systems, periplasmic component [Vibrio nigripulchritudo FTn2]CCN46631.1 putative ABC-type amino acid transport/signal transduction systems, periplasmic component [Vibrio nigripulchritudo MADA3020]CCN54592.1 putati
MLVIRPLFIAFIFACSFFSVGAHARTVKMVTVDWAPFYGSELKRNGVVTAIVQEAFLRSHYSSSIRFTPWKRALAVVEKGEYDVAMGGYYSEERAEKYFYSDPIFNVDVGLVALNKLGVKHYESLEDLKPYRIGVSLGWANGKEFDSADYLTKEEASNQILNVRKLFRERVDMIAVSFAVFRYEARALSHSKLDDVVYIQPPLSRSPLYLLVSKNIPDGQEVVHAFNKGLSELRADGTYDALLKEFNVYEY